MGHDVQRKAIALSHSQNTEEATALLRECEGKAHTSMVAYGLKDVSKRIEEYNLATLVYATGARLSSKLIQQAEEIRDAKVLQVSKRMPAHEELLRKWGGAFAVPRWEPQ